MNHISQDLSNWINGDNMPTYTRTADAPGAVVNKYNDHTVVEKGDSVETYKILGAGWTKTSDEPYFALSTFRQTVTSPGTVTGLIGQHIIRVMAAADGINMTANAAANPNSYPLTKGVAIDIVNDSEIESLASEARECADNMEAGNLGQTQRCQTFAETQQVTT